MCGIAGIHNLKDLKPISPDHLKQMIGLIQYRGPDETGFYLDDRTGLGHARLSIIDLSSGTQPLSNEDQTLWIVFNGEIFNYIELHKELVKRGHRFSTTSDTEVILHLYEEKGPACLDEMNGQFAFAIWDSAKNELFLARDRVGIRPVYYTRTQDRFYFASEIKAIFANGEIPREIDPAALDQVFQFWTTLPGRTPFRNIHELPPGHYLKITGGRIDIRKYWEIPFTPADSIPEQNTGELIEEIREILLDATRIRMRADVPVGCYLSGGLDSSGLASLIVQNFNRNVNTFGIRFEDEAFDEGEPQQLMAQTLGTNHEEMRVTNQRIGASFPDVIWHCERPLLRTAPVPLFLLSSLVQQHQYKVVVTGEGADEIFGGYNIFREMKVRRFWARQPESQIRPRLIGKLYPYIFKNPRLANMLQSFFARNLTQTDDPLYSHRIRWENTAKTRGFYSPDLKSRIAQCETDHEQDIIRALPESFSSWESLAQAQYLEANIFLSNYLLSSQGDRMAMAHSVEIRLPYLDYRLIERMGRVPARLKILGLNEKFLLKKIYQDILPNSIVKRSKHPYRAPVARGLLNEQASGMALEMLSMDQVKIAGLFDVNKVGTLLNKVHKSQQATETEEMALAGILSSQLLHEQFIRNFSVWSDGAGQNIEPKIFIDKRSSKLSRNN